MWQYYWIFLIAILFCAVLAGNASRKVNSTFRALNDVPTSSRMTGYDTATRLLRANGVRDISVGRVKGALSDHYHPTKKIVNLSESVYGNDSVAAVAVAAHEIGHVMQKKKGYVFYKLRSALVTVTNIGSRLALPLVLFGLILDLFVMGTQNSDLGFYLAIGGVALYGLSTLFALVTLPVEYDASRRAKKMLVKEGILTEEELPYADKMLDAAAQTYLASLLVSLVYFLRFAVWVMLLFGRNRRD
ncbi:MAG: zinc metallopeptidase [Clostridia bacterium]|nr:zinc metallopeptidase [Clostridia bacterium]